MQKRILGNSDLHLAPVTFGGNVFGWTIDEKKSGQLLDAFIGAGFNTVDTADVYSRWVPGNKGGESESIIGNWMKKRKNRHDVIVATKVGSDMGNGKSLKKKYILQAVEDSLKRLQTDHIDLYQTHFDDQSTPVEETLEAYGALVKAGKVRWIGTSNMSAERIKESLEASKKNNWPIYQSLQPHYNLYAREHYEKEYEQLCLDHNLGVISYYSLESGFLTGKYRSKADLSKSPRGGGMEKYFNDRGLAILDALDTISAKYRSTPASIAIAWLIARESITAPIASATSVAQFDALIKAAELELTTDDINLLGAASSIK